MRLLLEIFEITSTATFVAGLVLNLLLLYLIRRFSTKELGTYKYLLEIFAAYDIYLAIMHYLINPKMIPSRTGFAMTSDREFGLLVINCFCSSNYAVPFALLNIHFVYRYWNILSPEKIALFSNNKFKALLITITLFMQMSWWLSCVFLGRPEDMDEIRLYQSYFREEYEKETNDGCIIMNYWRDGSLCIRPFLLLIVADSVEIVSISLAAVLATLTYREITKALHISERFRAFQLRILLAAIAHTLTPVLFVYTPYFMNVNISLFSLYSPTFSALSMVLLSFFPGIDAIVIIVFMRPYRKVTGFILNLLLLYLIRRFSSKELGTYKYLLEIFAAYDTYLVVVHHVANPKVIPSSTGFSFVSDRDFAVFEVICFHSSCYVVPFVILNIHLLYRYWTIRAPHLIDLFSNGKFIALLVSSAILFQISWFLACWILARPEDIEEIHHYQSLFREEYGRNIHEGPLIMNYWRDGELSIRPFAMLLFADGLEIISFGLAATLATLTYQEIRKAQNISEKLRIFQLRILLAASAQTLTPLIFVYITYFFDVTIPLFHGYAPSFSALSMVLLACFPCIDAVVIIVLMKPYRDGLLRMLGKKDKDTVKILASAFTASTVHGQ